jgi:hypothetical protein
MSLLDEARTNVLKNAKFWDDIMALFDTLESLGNRACHDHIGKDDFFKGLSLMRSAAYHEQSIAIRNCFCLSGVANEEVQKYSLAKFKEAFGPKCYSIMHFLDQYGRLPTSYKVAHEEQLRKEAMEAAG